MTRYARIVAGRVVTAFDTDRPASDFPDLELIEVAADVRDNDFVDGNGEKVAPPAPPPPPREQVVIEELGKLTPQEFAKLILVAKG